MSEIDIYQKLTEIEEAPRFSMIFGESSDRTDRISEHRLWLQNIRKEHPLPATPYRVDVYIRYFNQTKYNHKRLLFTSKKQVNIPRQSRGLFIDGRSPNLLAAPKRRIYGYHMRKAVYLLPVNGSMSSIVN